MTGAFDKEASQTRDYYVAGPATFRAARPDPSLHKGGLLGMTISLNIRPATSADIPALMALEMSAVTAAHWSEERYQAALSQSEPQRLVLGIENESGLQGFLIAREVDREWEIENVVIAETLRRRRLGSQLLVEFLNVARSRGAMAVFLEVRESNLAARRLYEKQGFAESGRRKGYYRQPVEDAVVYRLHL